LIWRCVAAGYPEIGREIARQIDADRNVGQRRQSERDRIADGESAGCDGHGIGAAEAQSFV
jgi:hypothetical protein